MGDMGSKQHKKVELLFFQVSLPHLGELLRCEWSSCLPNDGNSSGFSYSRGRGLNIVEDHLTALRSLVFFCKIEGLLE